MKDYQVLFGPIVSRRLGLSLGINLIPKKTCNLNCIYCEVGHTTHFVRERKEYFPTSLVIDEINNFLKEYPNPDQIEAFTFSGAGEPTLASNLGEVIKYLKSLNLSAKVVVITNSLLFENQDVFNELLLADSIMPSLDAATQGLFQKIDRGVPEAHIDNIIDAMERFSQIYQGEIHLEIFLADEKQLEPDQIQAYQKAIERIKPHTIDINVLDRPGAIEGLKPIPKETLERFRTLLNFKEALVVENKKVKNPNKTIHYDMQKESDRQTVLHAILGVLIIRPSTLDHLIIGLGIDKQNILEAILILKNQNEIKVTLDNGEEFYAVKDR